LFTEFPLVGQINMSTDDPNVGSKRLTGSTVHNRVTRNIYFCSIKPKITDTLVNFKLCVFRKQNRA